MNSRKLEERVEKIESFVSEGLTRKEIGEKLGIKYYVLANYLYRHPEIPRPTQKESGRPNGIYNLEEYNQIKNLLDLRLNQSEIARRLDITKQAINDYLKHHPELEKPKNRKYNRIKNLIENKLTRKEIINELKLTDSALRNYLYHHPELREIYDSFRRKN